MTIMKLTMGSDIIKQGTQLPSSMYVQNLTLPSNNSRDMLFLAINLANYGAALSSQTSEHNIIADLESDFLQHKWCFFP